VVCVVSHDRYFLNRVCTDILAFEGDGRIQHSAGDYDYYLEKRERLSAAVPARAEYKVPTREAAPKPARPRKLTFHEQRELAGMEAQLLAGEAEVVRIEGLFASPDFHRTHAPQTNQLKAELEAAKEKVSQLYARWEELEAIRAAANSPAASVS